MNIAHNWQRCALHRFINVLLLGLRCHLNFINTEGFNNSFLGILRPNKIWCNKSHVISIRRYFQDRKSPHGVAQWGWGWWSEEHWVGWKIRGGKVGNGQRGGLGTRCLCWFCVSLSTDAKVLTTAYTVPQYLAQRDLSGPVSSLRHHSPILLSSHRPLYQFSLLCNKLPTQSTA